MGFCWGEADPAVLRGELSGVGVFEADTEFARLAVEVCLGEA